MSPGLAAVLAAGMHVALVVGVVGVATVVTDRDPIDYPDAGPLLGPAMVAAGALVVAVAARAGARADRAWPAVVGGAAGAAIACLLTGAVGYALIRGELAWVLLAGAHLAAGPLVLVTLGAAAASIGLARLLVRVPGAPTDPDDER